MTKLKKTALAFGTACALALTGGLAALNTLPAAAEESDAVAPGYYGAKLTDPVAVAFYGELVEMTKKRTEPIEAEDDAEEETEESTEPNELPSEFRKGESHKVESAAILEKAEAYETGDMTLVKQFGAALDSFRYDYADLFYIDFDALTFTVTKSVQGSEEPEPLDEAGEEEEPPVEIVYEYGVTIGAGNAQSYFLNGVTEAELNKENGLIATYEAKLAEYVTAASEAATAKEKAAAVSKELYEKITYGYGNAFSSTAYSIVTGNANSEGLARAFKAVMNALEVDCELVSGYYVNGSTKAWTWNYVKDGSSYYAVDVAGNLVCKSEKYVNATAETFNLDHFEDGVVSLSKYKLVYPTLASGKYAADTGALEVKENVSYGEGEEARNATVVLSYAGRDVDTVMIRVKDGENWGEWQTITAYAEKANTPAPEEPAPEAEEGEGEGEEEAGEEEPAPAALPNVVIDTENEVAYFFVLEKADCEFCLFEASGMRLVPVVVGTNDASLTPQKITATATTVTIKYAEKLEKIDEEKEIEIDWTVESLLGGTVAKDDVKCTVGAATLSADGLTVTFDFTPSNELKDNALRYTFTPKNLGVIKEETVTPPTEEEPEETEPSESEGGEAEPEEPTEPTEPTVIRTTVALPYSYSLVFGFESVVAEKVYGGNSLYSDIVVKPSLAFNSDLSLDGWKYGNDKDISENMRSSLTLSVTKPVQADQESIAGAAKTTFESTPELQDAVTKVEPYNVSLTMEGYAVTIPESSYIKLAFPYPVDYAPGKTDNANAVFKVLQFKRVNGEIDYTNPTVVDAVATRQGIVAAVNGVDAFAVIVLDKTKIGDAASEKAVLTQTSGVGGKVTADGNKPVNTLNADGSVTYTITPDAGYKVGFVTLNGKPVENITGNTVTVNYSDLVQGEEGSEEAVLNNVLQVEFVKNDADELTTAVAMGFANGFIQNVQFSDAPYDATELGEINKVVYPSGVTVITPNTPDPGVIDPPIDPSIGETLEPIDTSSTKLQYIILLSVVGGIVLIGVIAIVYCAAIRPKIIREREEEAARIAANRERRAKRNRMSNGISPYDPRDPRR